MAVVAEIVGIVEMRKLIGEVLPREVRAAVRRGFRAALNNTIAPAARAKAPRDEGNTAKSIKVRAGKRRRGEVAVMMVAGGETAPHASFQELGWMAGKKNKRHVPGKGFLRGSFYGGRDDVENAVAEELRELGGGKFSGETDT